MVNRLPIVVWLVVLLSTTGWAGVWEVRVAYEADIPSDKLWEDHADGHEVKLIHWWEQTGMGLAVSAGNTRWGVQEQVVDDTGIRKDTLAGDIDYTTVGVSALMCRALPGYASLLTTVEVGLRHMGGDAALRVARETDLGNGSIDSEHFSLDGDDGLVGRLSAGLELMLNDRPQPPTLFLHLGHQFNLSKGQASQRDWPPGFKDDLDLSATYLQIGFAIPIQ